MNEAQKMLWNVITEPRKCWDCGEMKLLKHLKYVSSRRWAGYCFTCDDCYNTTPKAKA